MYLRNTHAISSHRLSLLAATAKGSLRLDLLALAGLAGLFLCLLLGLKKARRKRANIMDFQSEGLLLYDWFLAYPNFWNINLYWNETTCCKSTCLPRGCGGSFARCWQTSLKQSGTSNGIAFTEPTERGMLAPWVSSTPIMFKASRRTCSLGLEKGLKKIQGLSWFFRFVTSSHYPQPEP